MRLIDIDPINKDLTLKKRVLTAKYGEYAAEDGSYMSWREIFELVNRQPEVDAVKVVRCLDCKNAGHLLQTDDGDRLYCRITSMYFPINGYCSNGERIDDGDNR